MLKAEVVKVEDDPATAHCQVYGDITQTIGQTPLVKLNRIVAEGQNIYLKLESSNPMGSQQDRVALALILAGETSGDLQKGGTVIDATTGNTGIALATICAQRGYQFIAVMSAQFSVERRRLMRAVGAKVLCVPGNLGTLGALERAKKLAEVHGYYYAAQFESQANADYHKKTTGPEIVDALRRQNIRFDYWVTGYGTGGTYAGVAEYLRSHSPNTKIVLCEPKTAPLVQSRQRQERTSDEKGDSPSVQHPSWQNHSIQGWTVNFLPKAFEDALQQFPPDKVVSVDSKVSMETAVQLATQEGIIVGISSGAAVAAACELLQNGGSNTNVVCMAPDSGDLYLSTPMFSHVHVEMSPEERELLDSVSSAEPER